jgi:spore germination protein YaaH
VLDSTTNSWRFSYVDGDGVSHESWYTDASTQETRMRLARDHGLGFGFWRLGNEDQRLWDSALLRP